MAHRKLSATQELLAVKLWTEGRTCPEIATVVGCSRNCAADVIRRASGNPRFPGRKPVPPRGGWPKNLSGLPFFNLTVIGKVTRTQRCSGTYWRCRCVCGEEVTVARSNLVSGNTKGCGCSRGQATFTGLPYQTLPRGEDKKFTRPVRSIEVS